MFFSDQSKTISGKKSLFLDGLRIISALSVFGWHTYSQWHSVNGYLYGTVDLGHLAVIVFFVLSGYVIAHSIKDKNKGILQYTQARLSRLYSIVLPAIIITICCNILIQLIDPKLAQLYSKDWSILRYLSSCLYLNEIWFFSSSPPINGPIWSLSYEFWYYAIFGLYFYSSKNRKLLILCGIACLIAGPKILAMMPIWILGNIAYNLKNPIKSNSLQWLMVSILLISAILLFYNLPSYPFNLGSAPLFFSAQFITDLIVGIFIASALWVVPNYISYEKDKSKAYVYFRKMADLTFPLYVLHEPLLILFRAIWKTELFNNVQMWIGIIIVFVISIMLGMLMEKNRYRWVILFKNLLFGVKSYI